MYNSTIFLRHNLLRSRKVLDQNFVTRICFSYVLFIFVGICKIFSFFPSLGLFYFCVESFTVIIEHSKLFIYTNEWTTKYWSVAQILQYFCKQSKISKQNLLGVLLTHILISIIYLKCKTYDIFVNKSYISHTEKDTACRNDAERKSGYVINLLDIKRCHIRIEKVHIS